MCGLFKTEWMCARSFRPDANNVVLQGVVTFMRTIDNVLINLDVWHAQRGNRERWWLICAMSPTKTTQKKMWSLN